MTYKLVLLRHGQSAWNKTNQFTGWVDVPLTEQGVEEAKNGGRLLKEKNVLPDIVFTSMLRRAINTATSRWTRPIACGFRSSAAGV